MSEKKITQSARGRDCQIRLPGVCNFNPETTVWCHANGQASGKGIGMKGNVLCGSYGCNDCHDVYDRRKKHPYLSYVEVEVCFMEGHFRTMRILIEEGLIKL